MTGKWTIEERSTPTNIFAYIMRGATKIARVYAGRTSWTDDARLIAAAPDMAEALKPFVEWLEWAEATTEMAAPHRADNLPAPTLWQTKTISLGDLRRARLALSKALGKEDFSCQANALQVETPHRSQEVALQSSVERVAWRSINTAPKDGTPFQARIPGHGEDNIIAWTNDLTNEAGLSCGGWYFVEEQEPPNCWTDGICWAFNEDGLPSVQPTHWKTLTSASKNQCTSSEERSDTAKPAAKSLPDTSIGGSNG